MVKQLVKLGCEVEVVTALPNYPDGVIQAPYRGRIYRRESWEGVPVHRVWLYPAMGAGAKRILNYLSFSLTCLIGLVNAKRPDFIFVESPPLFLSLPAWLMSRLWRRPFIFNVADLWPDSIRAMSFMEDGVTFRMAAALEWWSYRTATYVNAVTEGIRKTLIEEKRVSPDKVLFLPNGVDTTMFAPRRPDADLLEELNLSGKRLILYAGNIGYAQGVGVALDAMELLKDKRKDLVLVLIGSGSEREQLLNQARQRNLSNVVFLNPREPEYVARLYNLALAGFGCLRDLPLFDGARPSKIFPVMASGKPVVFSGAGEGARLIEAAQAGVVAPPENAIELARAFSLIADDPELATQLGKNGRAFVEKNLQWSALIDDWLSRVMKRSAA